jgi:hypothetical protein
MSRKRKLRQAAGLTGLRRLTEFLLSLANVNAYVADFKRSLLRSMMRSGSRTIEWMGSPDGFHRLGRVVVCIVIAIVFIFFVGICSGGNLGQVILL